MKNNERVDKFVGNIKALIDGEIDVRKEINENIFGVSCLSR
jgi:hypothetical protein